MNLQASIIELHIFRRVAGTLEFLLLRRSEKEIYPNLWQMVSGSIEAGETAIEAAKREMLEESGLTPKELWIVPRVNSFYAPNTDILHMIPVFIAEVEPDAEVILSDEHTAWQWVSGTVAKRLLSWHGQRKAVELAEEYFGANETSLLFNRIE